MPAHSRYHSHLYISTLTQLFNTALIFLPVMLRYSVEIRQKQQDSAIKSGTRRSTIWVALRTASYEAF